jgi:MFS family permease
VIRVTGPLSGSYAAAVALVLCALTPYLALSTALVPLTPVLTDTVGLGEQGLELASGMANAAYAFGTVAAVQLALHLPGRRLLVLYAALFTLGSVLVAGASTPAVFVTGRVMQGLFTSMMLIAAVPPLVTVWPASKLPWTAATMNMGIFGAVALGPVVGGAQAGSGSARLLLWLVAGVGAAAFALSLLTFRDQPPQDRKAPWDWVAQILAGAGCAAAFFGASELQSHGFLSVVVLLPLLAGVAAILALLVHQFVARDPLMPMRSLATTFPVAGVIVAMCAGAASVAVIDLAITAAQPRMSPTHLGMLFWPEFGGAIVMAVVFGALFTTRFVPLVAFAGMALLAGGAAVLSGVATGGDAVIAVGAGLVGVGVGASVSPALFTAGFSLRSAQLPRVFAMIELLRGVAAFIAGPVLLHLARTATDGQAAGIETAIWVCFGLAVGGGLVAAALFALSGARLRRPDLDAWLAGEQPAVHSPPLLAVLRHRRVRAAARAAIERG